MRSLSNVSVKLNTDLLMLFVIIFLEFFLNWLKSSSLYDFRFLFEKLISFTFYSIFSICFILIPLPSLYLFNLYFSSSSRSGRILLPSLIIVKVPLFTKIVPNVIASTPIIETALGISSIPKRHPKT